MRLTFQRHEEYKSSNIGWVDKIPLHWEIVRAKDVCLIFVPQRDKPELTDEGGTPWITSDLLKDKVIDLSSVNLYVSQAELQNKKIRTVPSFSILATCIGEFSLTAINKTPVVINQQIQAYSFLKKQNIYFIRYQVQSSKTKEYFERFATETTIRYINKEKFALTPLIIPPIPEQKTIAHYLDTKTAEIDRKIDLLTQKAQRYEELKKSLINETVTRGLDKSVPMKDSGIEWLGEIPEHWNIQRLKDLAEIQNSNVDKKTHPNEISIKLCNYVDVYKNDFIDSSLDFMEATATKEEIRKFRIKKGDVFITKDSETCDDIAIPALASETLEGIICGYHLTQIRVNSTKFLGAYLFRLFQSEKYGVRFVVSAKGITRVGLGQSAILDALTPIPPIDEQKAIATYLDTKTAQIDQIIQRIKTQIEKLQELRKTLINDVVTGKIKVIDN
ncbi:MAG: restriction endonuclease subunit S [Crocosphaera sp.]